MECLKIKYFLIFMIFCNFTYSQRWCGFERQLKQSTPIEKKLAYSNNQTNSLKTIPTIVHVLYNGEKCCPFDAGDSYGEGTHITESMVNSKINDVNNRFSILNANIELCLAQSNNFGSIESLYNIIIFTMYLTRLILKDYQFGIYTLGMMK